MIQQLYDFFDKLVEFLLYLPRVIFDGILTALSDVITAIDAPDFLTDYPLESLITPEISYLLEQSSFGICLGIIASGITFRFLRRVLTLGIW